MQQVEKTMVWCGLALACATSPATANVLVNELMADPASDWNGDGATHARDDEWLEIVNTSTSPADLTGLRLASADTTWRYEFAGKLEPGGVRVIFGSDSYAWEQATGNPAFGLRLTNTGGTIGLWRVTATDTTLVDEVTYLDADAEDDRSAGRLDVNPDEWVLFDGLNPYGGEAPPVSTGCPPTPGATNECLTPVRESSWGTLKMLYDDGS